MVEHDETAEAQIKTGTKAQVEEVDENFMQVGDDQDENHSSSDGDLFAREQDTNLEVFDCFNRGFVRAMTLAMQDIGSSEGHRQSFIDLLGYSFRNMIRLSNSLTGSRGAVADLNNFYVREVI